VKPLYPGYDVVAKRSSPSWNDKTREVVDARLAMDPEAHAFLDDGEWRTLKALCARIAPQPPDRQPPAPVAALVDEKLAENAGDGYRRAGTPPLREAWRIGLAALDAEARLRHGVAFADLFSKEQDELLSRVQAGEVESPAWADLPAKLFFKTRVTADIVAAYYSLPCAWSEIGFGGPASPRGYVRMNYDRRDPWEAAEARPGREETARRENARI
jgi:hypothetical protein